MRKDRHQTGSQTDKFIDLLNEMKYAEKLGLKQMEDLLWAGIAEAGNIPEQLAEIANDLGSRAEELGYLMDPNLANYLFLLDRLFGYAK